MVDSRARPLRAYLDVPTYRPPLEGGRRLLADFGGPGALDVAAGELPNAGDVDQDDGEPSRADLEAAFAGA